MKVQSKSTQIGPGLTLFSPNPSYIRSGLVFNRKLISLSSNSNEHLPQEIIFMLHPTRYKLLNCTIKETLKTRSLVLNYLLQDYCYIVYLTFERKAGAILWPRLRTGQVSGPCENDLNVCCSTYLCCNTHQRNDCFLILLPTISSQVSKQLPKFDQRHFFFIVSQLRNNIFFWIK